MLFVISLRVQIYYIYSDAKIRFVSQRYFVFCITNFVNYTFLCEFKKYLHRFRKKM